MDLLQEMISDSLLAFRATYMGLLHGLSEKRGTPVCLGIPKYMNIFVWELAVNFNESGHAGNRADKVMPDAQGNLIRIILKA